jgi:hypothetical protein
MKEKRTARNWYWWLWLSPLLTVPTLFVLLVMLDFIWASSGMYFGRWGQAGRPITLIAVAGSSLWHLILLIPALGGKSAFVRWHGWQALLLAAVRTAIPLAGFGLAGDSETSLIIMISLLLIVWFGGTLWGQLQAGRGECTLMRWFGRTPEPVPAPAARPPASTTNLLDIVRYSANPDERLRAVEELKRRGMAEPL